MRGLILERLLEMEKASIEVKDESTVSGYDERSCISVRRRHAMLAEKLWQRKVIEY